MHRPGSALTFEIKETPRISLLPGQTDTGREKAAQNQGHLSEGSVPCTTESILLFCVRLDMEIEL